MKNRKIILTLKVIAIAAPLLMAAGCSYNELPPKTDDVTTDYVLPKGEVPTSEERALVEAARTEYANNTK